MARWIDHFKEVVDVAVQYDPVHAALPWAGVRFLLQVHSRRYMDTAPTNIRQIAVNDFKTFDFVLEKIPSIAELVCRCALAEEITLRYQSPAAGELRRALVQLYASVMVYLAGAREYFEQSTKS